MDQHAIPVIELWGRLIVALQGDVGDTQMERLREEVLQRVRERGAQGLVIDASGMWMVDSHLCAMLGRIVSSARLMGVRAVLSGLSPQVVLTLGEMGIDLEGISTALTLEEALESLGVAALRDDQTHSTQTLAEQWIELTGADR
ncbi:MAG: STAS domain-containing protein [Myxococcales bacterium]